MPDPTHRAPSDGSKWEKPGSTPTDRHAAYLAALDERAERMRKIRDLAERNPKMRAQRLAVAEDLVITAGRRNILERHAPLLCSQCPDSRQHYVDAAQQMVTWPSEDYRDAAAGLEVPDA